MKKFAVLLGLMMTLLLSCDKYDDPIGGTKRDVFVLQDGRLETLHMQSVELPVGASVQDLQVVSVGVNSLSLSGDEGIRCSLLDDVESATVYDTLYGVPRYVQTIRIEASENKSSSGKKVRLSISTINPIPELVVVDIVQKKR